jgi:hypothetical protein
MSFRPAQAIVPMAILANICRLTVAKQMGIETTYTGNRWPKSNNKRQGDLGPAFSIMLMI